MRESTTMSDANEEAGPVMPFQDPLRERLSLVMNIVRENGRVRISACQ